MWCVLTKRVRLIHTGETTAVRQSQKEMTDADNKIDRVWIQLSFSVFIQKQTEVIFTNPRLLFLFFCCQILFTARIIMMNQNTFTPAPSHSSCWLMNFLLCSHSRNSNYWCCKYKLHLFGFKLWQIKRMFLIVLMIPDRTRNPTFRQTCKWAENDLDNKAGESHQL